MLGTTIVGPNNGNLRVYAKVGQEGIRAAYIVSNNTKNIDIEIDRQAGDNLATEIYIDGSDIGNSLSLTCNADCYGATVICPQNINADCTIDCRNTIGNFDCRHMDVYTKYGLDNLEFSNIRQNQRKQIKQNKTKK